MSDIRKHLEAIYMANGSLTPANVVDAARPATHPLHDRFEWDNQVAGEAYRRVQAAELIRSVKVTYASDPDGQEKTVREWVSVTRTDDDATGSSQVYVPIRDALTDPQLRAELLAQCQREWLIFKRKYDHLAEFAQIVAIPSTK